MSFFRFASVSLLFFLTLTALGQGIEFENGTWSDAIRKARKQKKLLFLHVDSPTCTQCNEVATKGFSNSVLREKFAVNFISFRTNTDAELGKRVLNRYEMKGIGSLFLDTEENLLFKYPATTSYALMYLEAADKALAERNRVPINVLEKEYVTGKRDPAFLRNLIERRTQLTLANDDVLDEYVRILPPDSLRTLSLQTFLFGQGPVLGSRADSVMRLDRARLNLIYTSVPYEKAIETNNRIISKTAAKAIRERNSILAYRTANFARGTYDNDIRRGIKVFDWHLMNYRRGIGDTTGYLLATTWYYDTHLMTVGVDSIRRVDEEALQKRLNMPSKPGEVRVMGVVARQQTGQTTRELNEGAMSFVDMARRPTDWGKALTWSTRALEFSPDEPNVMDTHARLLHKLGRRPEAVEWLQKVVNLQKERVFGTPGGFFETTLQKMKDGTL